MEPGSAHEIWEAALGELQVQVTKSNYRTWLEKTEGLSHQGNQFVIGVPNAFIAEYLDQNQRSLIEKTLIGLTHPEIKVVFHISPDKPATVRQLSRPGNSKYTFESFIVSNSNRLAYAAALSVAENPGKNYNPLFIFGGVGLGKTHLLHAIYNMAQGNNINALYVSAEQFTNDFINALRGQSTEEFRTRYRSVDMLLIDDIHFISGKEQTEESFFHTFNELHNSNRQIVVTSDCPPKAMSFGDRLCSRFEWGLIADIKPPDFDTRLAILRAKAEQEGETIAIDVLEFIARRVQQNIRELEGCLNRAVAYARLLGVLLTPELAAQAVEDIAAKDKNSALLTPKLVLEAVASSFGLTLSDLKSRKRDRETALARGVAMYLLKQATNCSLAQIGLELGNRDHATVIHACQKITNSIDNNPPLKRKVSEIQQGIYLKQKPHSY